MYYRDREGLKKKIVFEVPPNPPTPLPSPYQIMLDPSLR
jgi:hypothetical protein